MKDPELVGVVNLQIPAPTDDFENIFVDIATPTPFYENIICSMQYNADTANVTPYPEDMQSMKLKTR